MVTPSIEPREAAQAGCEASYSEVSSYVSDVTWWKLYALTATEVTGWRFVGWKMTYNAQDIYVGGVSGTWNDDDGHSAKTWQQNSNYEIPGSGTDEWADSWETIPGYRNGYRSIISVVAVFEEVAVDAKITVNTSVYPDEANQAGCAAEPTTETKTGSPGSLASFSLSATAVDGWKFKCWKDNNGSNVYSVNPYSFSKTFTNVDQVFNYIAMFVEDTGEILHGSSGIILHGSAGSIIYKG